MYACIYLIQYFEIFMSDIYIFILTAMPFQTDERPLQICYMCCARLHNCYKLQADCLQSEKLFSTMLKHNRFKTRSLQATNTFLNIHQIENFSILTDLNNSTDDNIDEYVIDSKLDPLKIVDDMSQEDYEVVPVSKKRQLAGRKDKSESCNSSALTTDIKIKPNKNIGKKKTEYKSRLKYNTATATRKLKVKTDMKSFKCDVCEKCFILKCRLTRHITQTHSGEKPYRCDICGKCFSQKFDLSRHTRIHTGEKPYKCNICDKCFGRKFHLIRHFREHTGENKNMFKCETCNKTFTQKFSLSQHIRIHTGQKPYKCDLCDKVFNQKSTLYQHIRVHTGEKPYKCNICDKCFSHTGHLNDHIRMHTGEKPFKCDICEKCFTRSNSLIKHLFTNH